MHSSSRTFASPLRPRRIDTSRRTTTAAEPKPHGPVSQREDKNMNTISSSSPRRATKVTPESSRTRVGVQPHAPLGQSRLGLQRNTAPLSTTKPKPKSVRAAAAVLKRAPLPPPPLPLLPHLDPNCNEPSLPCLCCDGHSPQDNNSLFNHNHNNNNTISIRQQLKLQPPPPPPLLPQRQEGTGGKTKTQASPSQTRPQPQVLAPACPPNGLELEKGIKDEENADVNKNTDVVIDNKKETEEEEMDNKKETEEEENSVDVEVDDDDDDDDTLVPSCCDFPPSLLDLSLTSSTSSSSTSISSCSDLESDCADLSISLSSSGHKGNADLLISQDHTLIHVPERYPASRSPPVLLLNPKPPSVSRCPSSPPHACSPDEGYPSAPASPSSTDYLGVKGQTGLGSDVAKLGLLDFLESVGDFGKMERFSQVIQVARWDLEGDPQGDLLRDRLDHLDRLESVNRQVKLAHIARLHEKGLDLGDLGKEDLSDVLDEMGNVDMSWKLYKGRGGSLGDSQEFSDAGVDLTAPSDCDEPLVSQSETSSPIEPPPRPPKPPARYASVNSELHTYINISRDITPSVSVCTSPSSSPTFYTFRCEKALPPSPRSVHPPLLCQPIPYFTLYKSSPLPFSLPSSTPPIPPPRRKHLARKEAQRLATLQAGCGKTPLSLPPPTSRPPPLPPAPTISISNSATPPAIPPPPSFHALDDEIRKLLVLAGLTQAELLKLSPELGVCVGGLEEEGAGETHHTSRPGQTQDRGMRRKEERAKEQYDIDGLAVDGWRDGAGRSGVERDRETDIFGGVKEDEGEKEESRDVFRTTSFTDMARRRKRNSGFGANVSLASDPYYSTGNTNTSNNVNFETFKYSPVLSEIPPTPPPRPLPPVPPTLPPLKVCTLLANSLRPERFDWLMAFSPDGETLTPPLEVRKSNEETLKKSTSGSTSSSGSTSGSGSKVMTFKELRNRSKHSSPAYQLITEPDPDPTVITPDPDFLYNLKWRREKTDSDGIQWEYTSQAQATFLQPPPLTSLAAFREMFQKAEDAIGQPELCPSQQIGCSASEGNLWRMDGQRKEEGEKRKEEVEEEEVEVRGTADGGRTWESRTTAVRSVSFAGSVQRGGTSWMGDDVKAPLRGLGLSSLCLLEKRALVSAVSVAVEAILAQFSSSRTLVQKALSGDSSVNPSLGRLVLQCLCPALRSLLSDGLKPHQSDLISGRRPNSAWGLVQASTRPGPSTQSLYSLQARIGELPQLRQNKHRFNAFLLGLLNIKLMDFWLSHLQSCSDVLVTFYRPSSFMRLSLTSCQPLFEELLLLLQPLSLLTLNLDLLFQHHHLEPANHSPEIPSPPNQDLGFRRSPRGSASQGRGSSNLESLSELYFGRAEPEATNRNASSSSLANSGMGGLVESLKPESLSVGPAKVSGGLAKTSPQLMWVQEKEMMELAPPNVEEASLSQQAGQVIQQGWGAVVRWGGKLGQNLAELSLSAVQNQKGTSRDPPEPQASTQARSDPPQVDGALAVPWVLGRLFGASNNPTIPTLPTRRPSQWLSPGVSVLTRMVSSSSSANQRRVLEPQQVEEVVEREMEETWDNPRPLRSVRTLCDHSGTGAELSFQKGEELVVLGGVDHDWIRCRQGDREGLVPIGYASLIL